MPIFEIIFNSPLLTPFLYLAQFSCGDPFNSFLSDKSKIVWYASEGYTAVAPKPIKHAIWWVSLAEDEEITIFASERKPNFTSFWWTQPTASKAFIGSLLSEGNFSIKWIITLPILTLFTTSLCNLINACFNVFFLEYSKLISTDSKCLLLIIAWSFLKDNTGDAVTKRFAWSGVSSNTFNSGP